MLFFCIATDECRFCAVEAELTVLVLWRLLFGRTSRREQRSVIALCFELDCFVMALGNLTEKKNYNLEFNSFEIYWKRKVNL